MTADSIQPTTAKHKGINRQTLLAFFFLVVFGGVNPVAIRFSNLELPPFWGATLRFAVAATLFWIIVFARRIEIPKGRALVGALIYGALGIGVSFAFIYWGLVFISASLTMVIAAISPLVTYFFAWLHRQESFRWASLLGGLIVIIGMIIGVGTELGDSIPLLPVLAIVAGVAALSEASVIYKSYQGSDPIVVNALALIIGAAILLPISLLAGEQWLLPSTTAFWLSFGYLVVGGTVILFSLFLYVLERWTATATSYSLLLSPIATIIIAAWLADEVITFRFLVGSLIVILGVWLGALAQPKKIAHKRPFSPFRRKN